MKSLKFQIKPLSAFGSPLVGDMLFGQICWGIAQAFGQDHLKQLLAGYTENTPFMVISDAFPSGFLPRPNIPSRYLTNNLDPSKRKEFRKKKWLPMVHIQKPSKEWSDIAQNIDWQQESERTHNSLDRISGTTGNKIENAPFSENVIDYCDEKGIPSILDLYMIVDSNRISFEELEKILKVIGSFGYGRDASTGKGRFEVIKYEDVSAEKLFLWSQNTPKELSFMTLANCAPQGLDWISEKCWYTPHVRFGRHGDQAALVGSPFKNPVLLAQTGAVLTPKTVPLTPYMGQGLGANSKLSRSIPETVQQGYAPIIPLNIVEVSK